MSRFVLSLCAVALSASVAAAAEDLPRTDAADAGGYEVVVVADPYARWDHTRWYLQTDVSLPYPVPLYAARNRELWIARFALEGVLSCELGEVITRHRREADCLLEDAGVLVEPWRTFDWEHPEGALAVLGESHDALRGLKVRLQVTDDGRVSSITLVDEPDDWRRVSIQYENLRQMVSRALVGFYLQTPERFVLGEDWTERNSAIFSLPSFRYLGADVTPDQFTGANRAYLDDITSTPGGGGTGQIGQSRQIGGVAGIGAPLRPDVPDTVRSPSLSAENVHPFAMLQAPASFGRSTVVHRMDRYKGRYVVQSYGEGAVDIGADVPVTFQGDLDAVSVFDPRFGVMTERVWTLALTPTAGSALADGVAGFPYKQTGRLRQLADGEAVELMASTLVHDRKVLGRGQLTP